MKVTFLIMIVMNYEKRMRAATECGECQVVDYLYTFHLIVMQLLISCCYEEREKGKPLNV